MKTEYTEADFANSVRNPYFSRLNTRVEVSLRNEDYNVFCLIGAQNGVSPEVVIRRCLSDYVRKLQDSEA